MLNIEKEVLDVLAERLAEHDDYAFPLYADTNTIVGELMGEDFANGCVSCDREKSKQWLLSNYDEIEAFVARHNIDGLPEPFSNPEQCELAVWDSIASIVIDLSPTFVELRKHDGFVSLETVTSIVKEWRDAINE